MERKIHDFSFEEKQVALDEANIMIMSNAERLEDIKKYIKSARSKYTTPILNEQELDFLIELAERNEKELDFINALGFKRF